MRSHHFFGLVVAFGLLSRPALAEDFLVSRQVIEDHKAVSATVESADTILARARIGGIVGALEIDEGDEVQSGQKLALIGDRKLALQIEGQDATLLSVKATRDKARLDYQRDKELFSNGTIPKMRFDATKTARDVAEKNYAAMRKNRDVFVQRSKEGAVIAPAAGRVLQVHVSTGSVVLPGEAIATLASENYLLRMNLPERHARFLKSGDPVRVSGRGEGMPERLGTVVLVYPQMSQGRVVADVQVEGLGNYFVGERTMVHVSTGSRSVFAVPERFLYARFGLSFLRLKDGTEVVVQTGQPTAGGIEILAGVKDGDVVVSP